MDSGRRKLVIRAGKEFLLVAFFLQRMKESAGAHLSPVRVIFLAGDRHCNSGKEQSQRLLREYTHVIPEHKFL